MWFSGSRPRVVSSLSSSSSVPSSRRSRAVCFIVAPPVPASDTSGMSETFNIGRKLVSGAASVLSSEVSLRLPASCDHAPARAAKSSRPMVTTSVGAAHRTEAFRIVYSADTGWLESLSDFAKGADLFICEATWANGEGNPDIHLSAPEAGRLAKMAGVEKLALTHVAQPRVEEAITAAGEEFGGAVEHAAAGSTLRP